MSHHSRPAIIRAAVANLVIAGAKLAGAALTGSSAMASEGVHSLVDTGNQGLLLLGLSRASRPPDERRPFGHGAEVFFWSFLVAILIFGLGAGVSIVDGVERILSTVPLERRALSVMGLSIPFHGVLLAILGLSAIAEGWSFMGALSAFRVSSDGRPLSEAIRRTKDPTVIIVLFEDAAAMAGLAIAFLGVLFAYGLNLPWIDGAASVAIGFLLAAVSTFLAVKCKGLLVGEAADADVVLAIRDVIAELPGVERLNEVATLHIGPNQLLVAISMDFRDTASVGQLEAVVSKCERSLKAKFPEIARVFVEAQGHRSHRRFAET